MFREMHTHTRRAYYVFANTFHANENGNGPWKLEIVRFTQIVLKRHIGGIIWCITATTAGNT